MVSSKTILVHDARDIVGESIVWSAPEEALYWVDIVGARIHRLEPATGEHREWQTPELPTSIGLRDDGAFFVGLRQRVCVWEPGGPFQTLAVPEPELPLNRLNEGVVAPDGTFWVGTMLDNIGPDGGPQPAEDATGSLYQIGRDGSVTKLTDAVFGITNSMVWLDNGRFVTADTVKNALYVFDHDADRKLLANQRTFAAPLERGLPDGSCRNADGAVIYNCRVAGGAAVAKLSADGAFLGYLDVPCQSPTSCAFGGPGLATLYVTSARFGADPDYLVAHPHEGGLYAVGPVAAR